jgi:hypothetical protein
MSKSILGTLHFTPQKSSLFFLFFFGYVSREGGGHFVRINFHRNLVVFVDMCLVVEVGADADFIGIVGLAPVEPDFRFVILVAVGPEFIIAFVALILECGVQGTPAAVVVACVGHRSLIDCL